MNVDNTTPAPAPTPAPMVPAVAMPTQSPSAAGGATMPTMTAAQAAAAWLEAHPDQSISKMPGVKDLTTAEIKEAMALQKNNPIQEAWKRQQGPAGETYIFGERLAKVPPNGIAGPTTDGLSPLGASMLGAQGFKNPSPGKLTDNPLFGPYDDGVATPAKATMGGGGATGGGKPPAGTPPEPPAPPPMAETGRKLSGAIDFLKNQPNTFGEKLLGLAGTVMDIIGSGKRAYAGVDSPTRLQREYQMRLASQQQANQIYASVEGELAKMDQQTANDIRKAIQQGQIDVATQTAIYARNYPLVEKLTKLQNLILYANSQTSQANVGDEASAAMNILGGKS